MRIWHRLKIFVPLLLTLTPSAECVAQQMMGQPSFGNPAFMAGPQPTNSATAYQGMPESFLSHPRVSPFDHAFEQHFTSDGLWFRRWLGGFGPGSQANQYRFNVDFVRSKTRGLEGLIGDPSAATFAQDAAVNNTTALPAILFLPTFSEQYGGVVPEFWTDGMRLSGGLENRLGWGLSWDVTYNGKDSSSYDARRNLENSRLSSVDALFLAAAGGRVNGQLPQNLAGLNERQILETRILNARVFDAANAEQFGVLGGTDDILDRSLYPYGSIPMQNGIDVDGFAQIFDLDFVLSHSVETFNTGAHVSFSPVYEKDSLRVRPIVGGRFFQINEGFGFMGVDSGLNYTINVPDGLDDDNDFVIDNVDEDGTLNFVDNTPDATQEILTRSFVSSQVRSSLGGPEIGVEYMIGESKGISFSGSTKFGALFNTERKRLAGDNIGDTARTVIDVGTGNTVLADMFDTTTAGGLLTQNSFTDQNRTTHISPMFQQSLSAQIPIFSKIPVLRDVWQLEHARFQAGWSWTWIGEVADPGQSIVWVSRPRDGIFPHLQNSRSNFYQNTLNLGVNWEF